MFQSWLIGHNDRAVFFLAKTQTRQAHEWRLRSRCAPSSRNKGFMPILYGSRELAGAPTFYEMEYLPLASHKASGWITLINSNNGNRSEINLATRGRG